MRFGVNLPGPFRVGVSSKGRISAGMSLGPFSVSGGVGGRRRVQQTPQGVMAYMSLDEAIAEARANGWKVSASNAGRSAHLDKGWQGAAMTVVHGGVLMRPAMSNRTGLVLGLGVILGILACVFGPYLMTR